MRLLLLVLLFALLAHSVPNEPLMVGVEPISKHNLDFSQWDAVLAELAGVEGTLC